MPLVERVVLVGVSGSGKSTVGRAVATGLGWETVDTDATIETAQGRSVPELFATAGEAAFRGWERAALLAAIARSRVVIATGGGAVTDAAVWGPDGLGRAGTLVVALDVSPAVAIARLTEQHRREGASTARPLLAGADPIDRMAAMKAARQPAYDRAGITLPVDHAGPALVAAEIVELVTAANDGASPEIALEAPSGSSRIVVAPGSLGHVGTLARARWPRAQRAWIVTDDRVGPLHAPAAAAALVEAGFTPETVTVPAGEVSKSLGGVGAVYDRLLGDGIERGDLVVALGGGVVGDLAGFAAATCLRGVGLVQVPTSLLAMVDSSVGGKTGINHAAGKNLIGAFYQPPLVVADPALLATLPERELTSGWAEVIKHAVIQASTPAGERNDLMPFLERNAARLTNLGEPALSYAIRRNVALKAAVVAADEREGGIRAFLNFGHTLGHAIEAAGYLLLHGEAIALGMRAATRIGAAIGICGAETVERLDAVLDAYHLPRTTEANADAVLALMGSDKKREAGRQRWVLPVTGGGVCLRVDVEDGMVREALGAVLDRTVE
ncbi:MAG: 3-dehydroquinate synthase [uncultured Thermomicrobiales bacterium]|uniref:Multifunctional fusion protein n=1 Tax=uncultured Thermomicrobiales bacterium TaxID=1645740 RepID=A0A6J4U209_9BACT|nr:MAG: 3-dehydroquinate synthase [uncultured Thermomicrobiales bacterium]